MSTPFIYVPLAVAAWWLVHESGIHATIAGVVLGLLTRVRRDPGEATSPAERLEHLLSPLSSAVAVPFFALMSAGVVVSGGLDLRPGPGGHRRVPRAGGRQADRRARRARSWSPGSPVPSSTADLSWRDVVGVAVLAGIGFTVSLLVADLSFAGAESDAAKTAVLAGSLVSAVLGALMLGHRDRFHLTP